jgi:hypothetical protein
VERVALHRTSPRTFGREPAPSGGSATDGRGYGPGGIRADVGERTAPPPAIDRPTVLRAVTAAEAAVVQSLLAGTASPASSRLPRRTLQAARRRLFLREWVHERYLPDLAALGVPELTLAVGQPFMESAHALLHRWRRRREALLLWASSELLFGVFASPPGAASIELGRALSDPATQRSLRVLTVDAREPAVPIFFDFEGAWARATGLEGAIAYPQPLPGGSGADSDGPWGAGERAAVHRLVTRPFLSPGSDGAAAKARGLFAARWERRCLRSGRVARRVFLDPVAVARWVAPFPDQLAVVYGHLRAGQHPEPLYRALLGRCGLRPFLFATDGRSVLVGALSARTAVAGPARSDGGAPVLPVLQRALSEIVVLREPLDQLETLVNHRYDHLLPDEPDSMARGTPSPQVGVDPVDARPAGDAASPARRPPERTELV